mmetsp:Transcript_20315/g.50534  ORF Transcript_20315/g.50534 Transcript_20315/m.50534 type:complete len:583 (+) Transcript_20315:314-2062(+)
MDVLHEEDWPKEAERMYERIEVLGKGSFGLVWMCQRQTKPVDEFDDEFVAVKNIEIKEEKGKVYAQREISILSELKHPNVIRLIREFPVYNDISRLVSLQLARGPNLQRVVGKRGAVGLPLCRLISRELVAAVSYLHGRGVLHRDIKPTNLILENTEIKPVEYYDYGHDVSIWSDGPESEEMVNRGKWRVMLVDFGFARALEASEIHMGEEISPGTQKRSSRHMRNSITLESKGRVSQTAPDENAVDNLRNSTIVIENGDSRPKRRTSNVSNMNEIRNMPVPQRMSEMQNQDNDESDELGDLALIKAAANSMRTITVDDGPPPRGKRRVSSVRTSTATTTIPEGEETNDSEVPEPTVAEPKEKATEPSRDRRFSLTQQKVRSMSALGTKAYAAPEIKHKLRNKTIEDHEKTNAALTECVADYGMIVDAYSVGWTLRVVLTGVPPNSTISKYMRKYDGQEPSEEEFDEVVCCCPCLFGFPSLDEEEVRRSVKPNFRVRDTDEMPRDATLFISALTKKDPEERMSIRQAQLHPWIRGDEKLGDDPYEVPQGDYPSHHGDPVVPLKCAGELTRAVEKHNYDKQHE